MSLIRVSQPVKYPTQQDVLDPSFISNYGRPAGLWTPTFGGAALIAKDFSGNGNNGTLTGGVTLAAGGFGVLGQGWSFDGTTGYISFASANTIFDTTRPFAVFAAYQFFSVVKNQARFCFSDTGSAGFALSSAASPHPRFFVRGLSPVLIDDTAITLTVGKWYFSCGVYTGSALNLYTIPLGGAISTATVAVTGTPSISSQAIAINGTLGAGGAAFWSGQEAIAGLIKASLSPAQVSSLYSTLMYGVP